MTLGLAVGLAFANTATVANGWINVNGTPTQLNSEPCQGIGANCQVIFENDPQLRVFDVYTDMSLSTKKKSVTSEAYVLPGTPPSN